MLGISRPDDMVVVQDAMKIWNNGGSMWGRWMQYRYMKGKVIEDLQPKMTNSVNWKGILAIRNKIRRSVNQSCHWEDMGNSDMYRNIYQTLQHIEQKDDYERGLWACSVPKMRLTLWKAQMTLASFFRGNLTMGRLGSSELCLMRQSRRNLNLCFFSNVNSAQQSRT